MLKEFKTAFNLVENSNDGKLSVQDTINLLKQLNIVAISEADVLEYFAQL